MSSVSGPFALIRDLSPVHLEFYLSTYSTYLLPICLDRNKACGHLNCLASCFITPDTYATQEVGLFGGYLCSKEQSSRNVQQAPNCYTLQKGNEYVAVFLDVWVLVLSLWFQFISFSLPFCIPSFIFQPYKVGICFCLMFILLQATWNCVG